MENTADAYRIENLSFTYPNRETPAVRNVSLKVRRGEFLAVCGPSGCGKTTLLRQLKPSAAPHGVKSGGIFFENQPLEELTHRSASAHIGFVMQSPENQIVTDKVWHELAFGLESLGLKTPEIRLRVAEMASFFGMAGWFRRPVTELSGGQKQLLSLASIMAMQPRVLILDEPTGQLDPIAAAEFLATVGKINRELGVTVIITEHRLEEVFPLCDRAAVMDGGGLLALGRPAEIGAALRGAAHAMFLAMPAPMRVWAGVENSLPCPVTVREGRIWLEQMPPAGGIPPEKPPRRSEAAPSVELADIWFKYGQSEPDIVRGLSFKAYPGEIAAILGGNGAGKTT
ncbi:MAG: ATP-binding cassette domain-containing protein, partial [Gracilibacteraceae bacterium]|nr:ATP-binding cassette domain-containing protein [Gracilibacteraceae bacterium]